jgi:8-oxo-dGTP pyrophosphatase MutT (NUDIX family)
MEIIFDKDHFNQMNQELEVESSNDAASGIEILHSTKWLELRTKNGYVYMHSPWCNAEAVCILPFRYTGPIFEQDIEFLAIMEHRPCHGEYQQIYSITGGCDKEGEVPVLTAIRELREETGYEVTVDNIIPLGEIRDCKASDMLLRAYAVEITDDLIQFEREGDGSQTEKEAYPVWLSEKQAVCDSLDPLLAHMILRLQHH